MNTKSNFFFYFFISAVILLIIILQYDLWFSNTGIFKYNELKKAVATQSKEVKQKSQTNAQLYSEVVSLRKNNEVLQSLARENMGLIKKGEVFYSVK
ncbi:FtsB family cell division protein [Francisella uliginis]|uniref:Cell division protein FtsB n=1 Tax=Francisella uliginis TaxID=573570 RepID=A0A1L4BRF6_9GAMM|nr:septum formation initiator family protein [Francisella uliginis]API86436.1 cell division protein [Francisella uliginis]